jgi:hypothetical protein
MSREMCTHLARSTRARRSWVAMLLVLVGGAMFGAAQASANAGNPILNTIHGEIVKDSSGTGVTVYVRGQWNWVSSGDCNFERAATGVAIVWNDKNSPGFPLEGNVIENGKSVKQTFGVGVKSSTDGNPVDEEVHPVDLGNQVEGYTTAGTDYPLKQVFNDATGYTSTHTKAEEEAIVKSWRGGCGREPLSATASKNTAGGGPNGEATGATCANGTTECKEHPWGSWGYLKSESGHFGYHHHYATRSDVTTVCANFYDVHGGAKKETEAKFQEPNANDLLVDKNGDNSVKTNSFNIAQGANCISFPIITTSATSGGVTSEIHDTAEVTGGPKNGSGTVTFKAFKNDNTCTTTPAFTDTETLTLNEHGSGSVTSKNIPTPVAAGEYFWIAEDTNPKLSTKCGDEGETSTVSPNKTTVDTGQKVIISDFAKVNGFQSGGTGTVTFELFNESEGNGATCTAGELVYTSPAIKPDANGNARTPADGTAGAPPHLSGNNTWDWVVSFNGDEFNKASVSKCGTEQIHLGGNTPGIDP